MQVSGSLRSVLGVKCAMWNMARQGPGLLNAMGPGAARGDRSRSE